MAADDLRLVGRVPTELRLLPIGVKARFGDAFDDPVFLMSCPAFALFVFDNGGKCWARSPLDVWTRCAEDVSWAGVLPVDRIYDCGYEHAGSCMIALKTSPIWRRLSEAVDCADILAGANSIFLISNVGRRKWRRFCASAGIADGLEDVRRVASAVKAAQERVGGNGAYGVRAKPESLDESRSVAHRIADGNGKTTESKSWLVRMFGSVFRRPS